MANRLTLVARIGYAARAWVYALIGYFALEARLRLDPHQPKGVGEASSRLVRYPGGHWLLGLLALGLVAHALFRAAQAILDLDHRGTRGVAWLTRFGFAALAIFYGGLAWKLGRLALGHPAPWHRRAEVAQLLAMPAGRAAILLVGVGLLVAAVVELLSAWRVTFCEHLDRRALAGRRFTVVCTLGRIGLAGRAVLFGAGGVLLLRSALRVRADTVGVGDVLRKLALTPFGTTLVAVVALGLFAYAAFLLCEARWHQV